MLGLRRFVARDNPKASEPISSIDVQFKAMEADVMAMVEAFGSARHASAAMAA